MTVDIPYPESLNKLSPQKTRTSYNNNKKNSTSRKVKHGGYIGPVCFLDGQRHTIVQTESGRYFDITDCIILTDNQVRNRDGLIPDAIQIPDYVLADLIAEAEERRNKQLERIQSLLEKWINYRRTRERKPNDKGKLTLQKKEVSKQ